MINGRSFLKKRFYLDYKIQIKVKEGSLLNDKKFGIVFTLIFGSLTLLIVFILLFFSFFGEEILEFFKDGFSEDY